jgi:hypothetical protein
MGNCNLPILMTLVVVSLVGFTSLAEAQAATCAQNLIPCANYINSPSPPANCCSSIKDAVDTQLSCLCGLYTSPGLLQSFNITVDQALKLSKACGVDTDLTKCNGTYSSFYLLITFVLSLNQLLGLLHPFLNPFYQFETRTCMGH